MKAAQHATVWRRIARKMNRLASSRALTQGAKEASGAAAIMAQEAADQYAAAAADGGAP